MHQSQNHTLVRPLASRNARGAQALSRPFILPRKNNYRRGVRLRCEMLVRLLFTSPLNMYYYASNVSENEAILVLKILI